MLIAPAAAATRTQIQAADPDLSVWVSASAGSGKTKVLTDRFVRLLLNGTSPHKILCLTYTQAAAAEMIERILKRLGHWAVCAEETLATELSELLYGDAAESNDAMEQVARACAKARTLFAAVLDCPGGLRIKTFHAFAQEIIARFPLEAGVVPHFTVLEEAQAEAMREEALDELLRDLPQRQETRAAWAALIGTTDLAALHKMLGQILHDRHKLTAALARYGDVEALRAALYQQLQIDVNDTAAEVLAAAVQPDVLPLAVLRQALALFLAEDKPKALKAAVTLQAWLELPPEEQALELAEYCGLFPNGTENKPRTVLPAQQAKAHPEIEAALQEEGFRIIPLLRRAQSLARAEKTVALVRLGTALLVEYATLKERSASLDFDDVIAHAAALLNRPGIAPWVLWKLDGGIDHIMIDEAQDTSPLQWQILMPLTEEFFAGMGARAQRRTLFVVGDDKQSIYSFQHAEPAMFETMRQYFSQRIQNAKQKFVALKLNVSFRSVPLVLEKIDAVFANVAAQSGVSSDPITHQASRQNAKGRVLLYAPQRPSGAGDAGDWSPVADYLPTDDPQEKMAQEIAATIKHWCETQRPVMALEQGQDVLRPVRPGDIMILLRRRNTLVPALVRALKQLKIPVAGVDRMVLRDEISVKDMLALIQFVLLPEDDLTLACVLRGPMVGMDEAVLEQLCVTRKGSLWQALREDQASEAIAEWLAALLAQADYGSVYDFLAAILYRPCPAAGSGKQALVARLGREALDPLDELLNRAQHFGMQHVESFQHFLHQMQRDESQLKRTLEHGAGEVRIMTVHAAKGLQAPIVILPDTCSVPRSQELAALQWDSETVLPYFIGGDAESRDAFAAHLHVQALRAQRQEYRRLLYVALTRAESELHLYGAYGENKPQGFDESWHSLLRAALAPESDYRTAAGSLLVKFDELPVSASETQPIVGQASAASLPDWVHSAAPPEAMPRFLTPSKLGLEDGGWPSPVRADIRRGLERGRLIHRLLQFLPTLPQADRAGAAARFLAQQSFGEDADALCAEVMLILEHPVYAPLFGPESRAEVPLIGTVAGITINGQIDRMVVTEGEVLVVDYKTNRPPPARIEGIPLAYRQQMAAYRILLQSIYPDKTVSCLLLWTYNATLTVVPGETLLLRATA